MKNSAAGKASAHSMVMGDAAMSKRKTKKPSFTLEIVCVEDRSHEIIKRLAKREIEIVLEKHGAVCDNLDEVLDKYITGEVQNDKKG